MSIVSEIQDKLNKRELNILIKKCSEGQNLSLVEIDRLSLLAKLEDLKERYLDDRTFKEKQSKYRDYHIMKTNNDINLLNKKDE